MLLVASLLCAVVSARAQYTIRWVTDPASTAVEVEGIPRDALEALQAADPATIVWSQLLAVYAERPVDPGAPMVAMPPISGTWKIVRGRLRFEPRFPFTRGMAYRAEFWPARLPGPLGVSAQLLGPLSGGPRPTPVISFFELPRDKSEPTTAVLQIYPTAEVLPENQSKFYVHFTGPMSRGGSSQHLELRDESGQSVELPFGGVEDEQWDPAMTRLTLVIDPSRTRRAVKPSEEIGPVFEAGRSYTLVVRPTWRDAAGRPLRRGFEKTFRVGPADRTPPDPARWKLTYVPPAGTHAPLMVHFDEPMDRALALRLISVRRVDAKGATGRRVEGEITLDEQERRWMLMPLGAWAAGAYELVIATTLEDLAGNSIGKTFDGAVASGARRQLAGRTVSVGFEVK